MKVLTLVVLLTLVIARPGHMQKREVMEDSTIHPKYKRLYQKSMDSVETHLQYLHKKGFDEMGPVADPRIVRRDPKKKRAVSDKEVDFENPQLRRQFDEYMSDFSTGMAHDMFHRLYEDMSGIDRYARYHKGHGPEKPVVKKPITPEMMSKLETQLKEMEDRVKERVSDRYDDMKGRFVERELKRREMQKEEL